MDMEFWDSRIWDSEQFWIKIKGTIKNGVKTEVGVDGVEIEDDVERYNKLFYGCVRFIHGSASCLIIPIR